LHPHRLRRRRVVRRQKCVARMSACDIRGTLPLDCASAIQATETGRFETRPYMPKRPRAGCVRAILERDGLGYVL
jgi:hypothetical protein